MNDDLFAEEIKGEPCPECDSEYTTIKVLTHSGFARMECNVCGHDWTSEDSYRYG